MFEYPSRIQNLFSRSLGSIILNGLRREARGTYRTRTRDNRQDGRPPIGHPEPIVLTIACVPLCARH